MSTFYKVLDIDLTLYPTAVPRCYKNSLSKYISIIILHLRRIEFKLTPKKISHLFKNMWSIYNLFICSFHSAENNYLIQQNVFFFYHRRLIRTYDKTSCCHIHRERTYVRICRLEKNPESVPFHRPQYSSCGKHT